MSIEYGYGSQSEPIRNETVLVGVTSKVICEQRNQLNKRKVLTIRNISAAAADIITISYGYSAAVADNGIVLRQYESFTDSNDGQYEVYQDQVSAICATANGKIAIMER